MEASQFVDGYAIKKNKFIEYHGKMMLALGLNFSTLLIIEIDHFFSHYFQINFHSVHLIPGHKKTHYGHHEYPIW